MNLYAKALELHTQGPGKIRVEGRIQVKNKYDLSLAYSPGVAEPCRVIAENPVEAYRYTTKGNLVAVVTDGTAVLGLGDIGPLAALPVMEGKALLFKAFAGVDGFPICLDTKDVDEIVAAVKAIAPTFGGINLEDISGPRCFEIEERLKADLDIPVFHDDQHGTAVVVFAGLINALKIAGKQLSDSKIVVLGAGAAGIAITRLLLNAGAKNIVMVDRKGAIQRDRQDLDGIKQEIALLTNPQNVQGTLDEVIKESDIFIGVAGANALTKEMVTTMASNPIVFALANPDPEIAYEAAMEAGVKIFATGRSDYPNQINNVLGFPGIFRGALDVQASKITENMKVAAAYAIANLVGENELKDDYIIPAPFDPRVAPDVAAAVAQAAINDGVAKRPLDPVVIKEKIASMVNLANHE